MNRIVPAAGGVVWRADRAIAVVHRPRYDDWSLPKGKLSDNEHPLAAAVREVEEETGVRARPQVRLPSVRYLTGTPGVEKTVDYWAMRSVRDDGHDPTDEVDEVRWLPLVAATDYLTYAHDRNVVAAFAALPELTGVAVLLRHASAGSREEWSGPDDERPLDEQGRADAVAAVPILALFQPARLISAVPVRCVKTIAPLADAIGVEIEVDPRFNEDADPDRAAAALRELAQACPASVVCSQGDLMAPAIAALGGNRHRDLDTPKGTGWVLSFSGRNLIAPDPIDPRPAREQPQ
jgi:8-oxo-dGTP pyrophosphatase MutT (NUDIX family)/phosphohistidine phosphatase SixA